MRALEFRTGLHVTNYDASYTFYHDILEMPLINSWDREDGKGAILDTGMGGVIEIIGFRFDRPSVTPAGVQIALRVEDRTQVDGWYKKAVQKGAAILEAPKERPWKHYSLVLADPDRTPVHIYCLIK